MQAGHRAHTELEEQFEMLSQVSCNLCQYSVLTHMHTHKMDKMDKCKELPHWVTPPQPKAGAPVCYFRELWASTDKLLKPGQVLAGALTVPSNYGVGTRSPTRTLVE